MTSSLPLYRCAELRRIEIAAADQPLMQRAGRAGAELARTLCRDGAILVLAMHACFAFLEVGTVRHKNQVNALSKILSDFAISALVYFFIGYWIAYGVNFFQPATTLAVDHGYALVKCFFLLTFLL